MGSDTPAPSESIAPKPERTGLTYRSLFIGIVAIPINAYILLMGEAAWNVVRASPLAMLYSAVSTLFLVGLGNLFLARKKPRWALSRSELAVIYLMSSAGAIMAGEDLVQLMMLHVPYPFSTFGMSNPWMKDVREAVPRWLLPSDPQALHGFLTNDFRLWNISSALAWLWPLIGWLGIVLAVAGLTLSFSVLVRCAWTEHERLSFPVAQIPIQMLSPAGLYAKPLFWRGFLLVTALDFLQGLHTILPVFPEVSARIGFYVRPETFPWNVLWLPIFLYPFAIGLTYFVPLDLAFTLWVVAFGWPFVGVAREVAGLNLPTGGVYALVGFQTAGAWLTIAILSLWKLRPHLREAWQRAIGRADPRIDRGEPMSYRLAFAIFIGSAAALLVFLHMTGMSFWLSLVWLTIYFLIAVALLRMRAELGPPGHDFHSTGPEHLLFASIGTTPLGQRDIASVSLFYWMTRKEGARFSPQFLEGFRIGGASGAKWSHTMIAQLLAIGVGFAAAYYLYIYLGYHGEIYRGADIGVSWQEVRGRVDQLRYTDFAALRELVIGAGLTVALTILRMRFFGFPLHPVGLAVGTTFMMQFMWLSVFAGWLLKSLVLRFGGRRLYERWIPFFVGLVVGDFVAGTGWVVVGILLQQQVWGFYPF